MGITLTFVSRIWCDGKTQEEKSKVCWMICRVLGWPRGKSIGVISGT